MMHAGHISLQDMLHHAPIRLVKLEFQLPEETFLQNIELAEKTLNQQRQALAEKGNIKEILRKHKVWSYVILTMLELTVVL